MRNASLSPSGSIGLHVIRPWPAPPKLTLGVLRHAVPWFTLPREVNVWRVRNFHNIWRGLWRIAIARIVGVPHFYGTLYLRKTVKGRVIDYGLASLRLVTDTGATKIVDDMRGTDTHLITMKFHGFGTGTTAESATDTALVTELTTQYATDNTRPTGTQTNNGAKVYQTVATLSPDADVAITEHGVFHQASNGGGDLLDRSKFAAINLVAANPDSLQATYNFTVNSGG